MTSRQSTARMFAVIALFLTLLSGCASHEDESIRRMMWYRPGPPSPRNAHTLNVGRYGTPAESGWWNEGAATSGSYGSGTAEYGRWPSRAAEYDVWGATSVGGEPIGAAGIAGVYGRGGSTVHVDGGTATTGSWTGTGASYGTLP